MIKFSPPDGHLYDVVAVDINCARVRVIDSTKAKGDAEAIVAMAVMRRGVDVEFFADVPHGAYKDGDVWKGRVGSC